MKAARRIKFIFPFALAAALLAACNANSPENKFLLAERLLEDKKYDAAIGEFQEIVDKAPSSALGLEAQLKIAQIQHLYLGRTKEAEASYRVFLKRNKDGKKKEEIEKTLADLEYQIFENYADAAEAYKKLIEKDPNSPDAELYTYNIARSMYFKSQFDDAIRIFELLKKKFPNGKYAKKSDLEIGNVLNAAGRCKDAIKQYEKVIQSGEREQASLAAFGEANCYEELDDLDKAYEILQSIKSSYPTPGVIELKLQKIKRRKIFRKR